METRNIAQRNTVSLADARGPEGMRLYVIGDIHGCFYLFADLYHRIMMDIRRSRRPPSDWRLIFLGDYVDRGPDSKMLLDMFMKMQREPERHIFLAGNHDVAFRDFLREPDIGGVFARYGGDATARSYGVDIDFATCTNLHELAEAHARLVEAVPPEHVAFLDSLRVSATFGDYFFCHAGIRPGVPLDQQDRDDLIWIRSPFLEADELFEKVVVHGHTPCEEPEVRSNRIGIDTGAYKTGRLTALVIDGDGTRFLST